jgi:dihydropteroate synthase
LEGDPLGMSMLSVELHLDGDWRAVAEGAASLGIQVHPGLLPGRSVLLSGTASSLRDLACRLELVELEEAVRNAVSPPPPLKLKDRTLDFSRRVYVVGIVNVTSDSFYDGGKYLETSAAVAHAEELVHQGADILEIGGESARPAPPTDPQEEIRRVAPVISAIRSRLDVPIAVDTFKRSVAEAALAHGADIVNDISGLADIALAELAATYDAALVVMHLKGRPKERHDFEVYSDLMGEIVAFLRDRCRLALSAGLGHDRIIVDPGPGFAKTPRHDLEAVGSLSALKVLGHPIMLAVSNKRFVGSVLGLPVDDRAEGTAAAVALGIAQGANLIRVHDVKGMARVARMTEAILGMGYND